jgi:hypothetical protein
VIFLPFRHVPRDVTHDVVLGHPGGERPEPLIDKLAERR